MKSDEDAAREAGASRFIVPEFWTDEQKNDALRARCTYELGFLHGSYYAQQNPKTELEDER